ncbi:MAG: sigma 54-interacting transcriptional regulator [Planctomycetota bacterium]|nr:sigma 54-interacting transcriptional regulator [Planctomycetota bacterium]
MPTALFSIDRLLESAADGIVVLDRSRRVVLFSDACERITGYDRSEVVGFECRCYDVLNCHDRQGRSLAGALCPAKSLFEGSRDSIRQRMSIRRKDGAQVWIDTIYAVMRNETGEAEFVLGVMRDAGEAHAREAELLGELSELREKVLRLGNEQKAKYGFSSMVSKSAAMAPVFEKVRAALSNSSSVLISGESGTGKEVVARTIHAHGLQGDGPFVPLNCSALPRDLIESELFGHSKGAFTGAVQAHKGLLRAAEGGTLFLDEIGQLPLETQAKLLRTLQDKRVRPVGSTVELPVRVRVIAAMNRPPRKAVAAGQLREDLFYRLSVIDIQLPPLRERREDIPLLVQSFIEEFNQTGVRQVKQIDDDAWRAMLHHAWPGNVRELSNAVESAFALGSGPVLSSADFPAEVRGVYCTGASTNPADSLLLDPFLARVEREAILHALAAAGWQRNKAAGLMGISRSRLYRRMDALGINPGERRP